MAALFTWLLSSCTPQPVEVLIDLKTDMVPGVEFSSVRTELFGSIPPAEAMASEDHTRVLRVDRGQVWDTAMRIADLSGIAPGRYYARVRLETEGETVLQRLALLTIRETSIFTVTMTRDCRGVMCPAADGDPTTTACLGGRCVNPRCTEETPEYCPDPACSSDADCASTVACASARCVSGACLALGDDALCDPDAWCRPDTGCAQETFVLSSGAGGRVDAYDLAIAPGGGVAVVGALSGAIDLGGGPQPAPPVRGMFIAQYGSDLSFAWGQVFAASGFTAGRDVTVTSDGVVHVAGYFTGSGMFGSTAVDAMSGQDPFLMELDASGAIQLTRDYATARRNGQLHGLATRDDGTTALGGVYDRDLTVGGIALPTVVAPALDWGFIAVLETPDTARYALSIPGGGTVVVDAVAFAPDGSTCATGNFNSDIMLDGASVPTQGGTDGFVVRIDPSGTLQWGHTFGGPGADAGVAVAMMGDDCVVAGHIADGASFDGMQPTTSGGDGVVVRYDPTGTIVWLTVLGGAQDDGLGAASLGPEGSVIVGGSLGGAAEIGGQSITTAGRDALVARIDGDGTVAWAHTFGGDGSSDVMGVGFDPTSGRVAVTARFSGGATLGRYTVTAAGSTDSWLHWFTP